MYRNFSEATRAELFKQIILSGTGLTIADLSSLQGSSPENSAGSLSYYADWAARLGIAVYIDNLTAYENRVVKKSIEAGEALNKIYDKVTGYDLETGRKLQDLQQQFDSCDQYIKDMKSIVSGGTGIVNVGAIGIHIAQIYQELKAAQAGLFSDAVPKIAAQSAAGSDALAEFAAQFGSFAHAGTGNSIVPEALSYDLDLIGSVLKKAADSVPEIQKIQVLKILNDLAAKHQQYSSLIGALQDQVFEKIIDTGKTAIDFQQALLEGAYYDDVFIKILKYLKETGQDQASFASALMSFGSAQAGMDLFGAELSGEINKLVGVIPAGMIGLTGYLAQIQDEHLKLYGGKVEVTVSSEVKGKTDIGDYKLIAAGNIGAEIEVCAAHAAWEDQSAFASAEVDAKVGTAYVDADLGVGLFTLDNSGASFCPGINAQAGAGISAVDLSAAGKISNDYIGVYAGADVDILKAQAGGSIGAVFFNEDGQFKPQVFAKVSAQANLAAISGTAGLIILGADVGVTGGLNVGVGAHAEIGYANGRFKADVGASLGVGVSFGLDVDVDGLIAGVKAVVGEAWSKISETAVLIWNRFTGMWELFWDNLAPVAGEAAG